MRYLDIENWNRKEHFHFFNAFDEPFYGITVKVDVTKNYTSAKAQGISFFASYLHKSARAVNDYEPFTYRIDKEGRVEIHDVVHAGATIGRKDGTFGFSHIHYQPHLEGFIQEVNREIARVQSTSGIVMPSAVPNIIHYSAVPWLDFTSLSHARMFGLREGIPKISFGKVTEQNGQKWMPVSIWVHHALIDAYHIGQYVELFQTYLNE